MQKIMAGTNATVWFQREIKLKAFKRGCHLIDDVIGHIDEIKRVKIGTCHVLMKHTSASICLNENWDSDVRVDMEMMLNRLAPENAPYIHTIEGPDDMPAHVKTALLGSSVTIPITDGRLNLGQWQGIWACEHRDHASGRTIVVTINGLAKDSK